MEIIEFLVCLEIILSIRLVIALDDVVAQDTVGGTVSLYLMCSVQSSNYM